MKTHYLIYVFLFTSTFFIGCKKDEGIDASDPDDNTVENAPPEISDQVFTVSSNIDSEETIGVVVATDPDDDELSFEMVEDTNELFEVTKGGELSLRDNKSLGNSSFFTITVSVTDGKLTEKATIDIESVFENSPPEINAQVFEIYDDISSESIIGTVQANDPDGDDLTFAILENQDNLFEISDDGIISLNDGETLSENEIGSYEITIEVSDGELSSNVVITIKVNELTDAAFITEWIVENSEEIVLPLYSGTVFTETLYDFEVNWGDGTKGQVTNFDDPDARHTYDQSGTYTITISGILKGFNFNLNATSNLNFIDVLQWGNVQLGNDGYVFSSCGYLKTFSAKDAPDLTEVTNMKGFFYLSSDFNGEIGNWDVSKVTDMSFLFSSTTGASSVKMKFNQDISSWDVSNVTDMYAMFMGSEFNQEIGDWDVSNVTDMSTMFMRSEFDQDISNWDVSNVNNMTAMFAYSEFNQEIGDWDVSNVNNMSVMFSYSRFNQEIGNWDVSNVNNMATMFTYSEFNQDIGNWDVSSVIEMSSMFTYSEFNQDIGNWDVSSVNNMIAMFASSGFNQDIGDWDVSNVNNMVAMFTYSLFNQDIGDWDVSSVIQMSSMFTNSVFNQDIGNWDVASVVDMNSMFSSSSFNQDISDWDVSNVTNTSSMFSFSNFNQDISGWDVSNNTNMSFMFYSSPFDQDLSNWDTSGVIACDNFIDDNSPMTADQLPTAGDCF